MYSDQFVKQVHFQEDGFKIFSYDLTKKLPVIILNNNVLKNVSRFENIKHLSKLLKMRFIAPDKRKCF